MSDMVTIVYNTELSDWNSLKEWNSNVLSHTHIHKDIDVKQLVKLTTGNYFTLYTYKFPCVSFHYFFNSKNILMLLSCGVGEDSWESLGLQGDPTSPSQRRSVLSVHGKYWCWSWNSNTLATWCEKLIHLKRPWSWERLRAGREGDNRGWDGWMASLTRWTRVWVNSGSWWWTGKPGMLSQSWTRLSDWTELNWKNILQILQILSTQYSSASYRNAAVQQTYETYPFA